MKMKYVFMLFLLLLYAGCSTRSKSERRPVITVTIEPYRYFVEKIVGNRFAVQTIVPQGGNPETYEPTARQMIRLSESVLYIKVGNLGFEKSWMQRFSENAPDTRIIDSSEGIKPMISSDGHYDPHVWMSIRNARIIARNICKAVITADKHDRKYYESNYYKFLNELNDIERNVGLTLKPIRGHSFIIYHPMLTYFADEFGLTQIPLEHEGNEPSATQLKSIITKSEKAKVQVLLLQNEFNNRNIEVVSKSLEIPIRHINPLGYDWGNNMTDISQKLR